jgi:hypothetical protein
MMMKLFGVKSKDSDGEAAQPEPQPTPQKQQPAARIEFGREGALEIEGAAPVDGRDDLIAIFDRHVRRFLGLPTARGMNRACVPAACGAAVKYARDLKDKGGLISKKLQPYCDVKLGKITRASAACQGEAWSSAAWPSGPQRAGPACGMVQRALRSPAPMRELLSISLCVHKLPARSLERRPDPTAAAAGTDGGRNPKWNERLYFPLNGGEDRIIVEVKDAVQSARPLGVASILLDKVRRRDWPLTQLSTAAAFSLRKVCDCGGSRGQKAFDDPAVPSHLKWAPPLPACARPGAAKRTTYRRPC